MKIVQSDNTGQTSLAFLQTENGMVSCFKREGDIIKKGNKKDKISYYVGWGIAYGTFAGGIFSVLLPEHLLVVLCLGIAFGAVAGVIFGKRKLSMKEHPVSHSK